MLDLEDDFKGPPLRLRRLLPAVERLAAFLQCVPEYCYDVSKLACLHTLATNMHTLAEATAAGALASLPAFTPLGAITMQRCICDGRHPLEL